jgi:hypothetical protein
MRRFILVIVLAVYPLSSPAATPKPEGPQKITVVQLEQTLAAAQGATDATLAQQLTNLELTQRLSAARFARLDTTLPGEKSRQALLLLADQSIFLDPPENEISADPTPSPADTRQMLVKVVNYVNTSLRQLPNFIATRRTTGFEDRPKEDIQESTAVVSLSYLPLHFVGESSASVTYRDHKEIEDQAPKKGPASGKRIGGLVSAGEFGPILSTVLADALKGKITWARWERTSDTAEAVFHYEIAGGNSHYHVRFCCIVNGYSADGQADMQVFDEQASYHGEIAFNPGDGSILRITVEADMPPQGLVPKAGMAIQYASVEIAGKAYICPTRSVSFLDAHVSRPQGMFSSAMYKGPTKTYLNDVEFGAYRRFGSESRILTGTADTPNP